jgi:lipopolysaccharide/colanic/teichoic acid biosynthesis glycosyltransferase
MLTRRLAVCLMLGGIAGVVFGASKLHATFVAPAEYDFTASFRLPWATALGVLLAVTAYAVGLPDVPRRPRQVLAASVATIGTSFAAVSLVQLATGSALLPRFVIVVTAVGLVPVFVVAAVVAQGGPLRARSRDRVVVIGGQEDSRSLMHLVENGAERPAEVGCFMTPQEALPVAGSPMPVRVAVEAVEANVVVLDREAQSMQPIVDQVALLHEDGVRVRTLSLFYEQWLGKLPLGELERVSLMFDIGEVHRQRYGRLKRLLDVVAGLILLPVFVGSVPLVALGNLVANRGPLFFVQHRVGKGDRVFPILKFRTMRGGSTTEWTEVDDARITPFGRVLRATHVDELPQVLNILRGDLSLVGPRPEQPHYVEELEAKLPYFALRHLVQPGLTGWAQVKQGYARTETDALEKLQLDFFYLRRQSLWLDMRIVARTLRHVLNPGEQT